MIQKYQIEIIAIGNGTASRETESFIAQFIKKYQLDVQYVIVSEAGASVYSASAMSLRKNFLIIRLKKGQLFLLPDVYKTL